MNNLDTNLFLMLNGNAGSLTDSIMHIVSGRAIWIPLYLLILYFIMRRYGWKYMLVMTLFIVAGVVACDQTCNALKDGLKFFRPTHTPSLEGLVHTVNDYRGGLYGTASAHAANSLIVAIISSIALKGNWFKASMILWLTAVCYSRIYLGVHFPSQILFGLAIGTIYGLLLKWLFIKYAAPLSECGNMKS